MRSLGVTIDPRIDQSVVCSCREWHGLRRYRRVRSLGVTRDDIACIYENVWGKPPTASQECDIKVGIGIVVLNLGLVSKLMLLS